MRHLFQGQLKPPSQVLSKLPSNYNLTTNNFLRKKLLLATLKTFNKNEKKKLTKTLTRFEIMNIKIAVSLKIICQAN
jgi:hypothetical protein